MRVSAPSDDALHPRGLAGGDIRVVVSRDWVQRAWARAVRVQAIVSAITFLIAVLCVWIEKHNGREGFQLSGAVIGFLAPATRFAPTSDSQAAAIYTTASRLEILTSVVLFAICVYFQLLIHGRDRLFIYNQIIKRPRYRRFAVHPGRLLTRQVLVSAGATLALLFWLLARRWDNYLPTCYYFADLVLDSAAGIVIVGMYSQIPFAIASTYAATGTMRSGNGASGSRQ